MSKVSQATTHFRFVSEYEPKLQAVLVDVLRTIAGNVDRKKLIDAIAAFDIPGALAVIGVDSRSLGGYYSALLAAHLAAVSAMQADMSKGSLSEPTTLEGGILAEITATVAATVDYTVVSINDGVQSVILYGFEIGLTAPEIADMILGRSIVVTNAQLLFNAAPKTGGTLGLSDARLEWVKDARSELSQKPPSARYLKRKLRDPKFDKIIRKAIAEGKKLSKAAIAEISQAYSTKIIRDMARRAALREVMKAANGNRLRLILAALGADGAELATKEWVTMQDKNVRHTHKSMHMQRVNILDKFKSPSGAQMLYPHDPDGGLSETAGCRCWFRARYKGKFV